MGSEFILDAVYKTLDEYSSRVATKLALTPNSPDERGRNKYQQESDRLERTRLSWQDAETPTKVGDKVLIPAGTPVGLSMRGFITSEPIIGVLSSTHSLRGGMGYMEHGHKVKDALAHITITLPQEPGKINAEQVILQVPNDMYISA